MGFDAKVSFSIGPEERKRFIGLEPNPDGTVQAADLGNKRRHLSKPNTNRVRGRTRQAHVKIDISES